MVSRRMASVASTAALDGTGRNSVKMRKLTEESEALIDLLSRQRLHTLCTETLHRKRAHHAAVKHSVFKTLQCHLRLRGKIPEETAGKGITRTRGIHDLIQRQGGGTERQNRTLLARPVQCLVTKERRGAILTVLEAESLRAHGEDLACGKHEVAVIGQELS